MAISRILSQHFASKILGMIIYLSRISPRIRRTFIRRDATIPEDQSGRLPFLCFVLHRMGFFIPHELLRKRCALTSRSHPHLHFLPTEPPVFFLCHSPSPQLCL